MTKHRGSGDVCDSPAIYGLDNGKVPMHVSPKGSLCLEWP